ncbi:MAG: PDZ domain-containing protein [Acidisphaera sp.]|nr:PDZ domain-containing protein [Acidisphaera sp.]MBV9811220.1 PDZ domain-containing protein [Acetobacteraceae bacterium]
MSSDNDYPKRRRLRGALVASLLGATALTGFAAGHVVLAAGPQQDAQVQQAPATGNAEATKITPTAPARMLPDFSGLVGEVSPAVVSITSKLDPQQVDEAELGGQGQGQGQMPMPFGFGGPGGREAHQRPIEARGSGFIISADGTVVTNNHVVRGATSVSVKLADGTSLPAKVVGRDALTDIAVLRVDAGHKLPYLQLGNSDEVKPGEWVVAMGNPFGLEGSVSAGIVSARNRDIGDGPYDQFIQVDAPINRGNSGGPLFTQDGKVVGVNTAILSPSGGSIGIGFAIPSNTVTRVVAELQNGGHVVRGYLGVSAQSISPGMAAALHIAGANGATSGALIASVQPNTPAEKSGLQAGDVITAVNGQAVKDPRDLAVDVAGVKPGEQAKLDVLRDGKTQTMDVAVAQMPGQRDVASNGNGNGGQEEAGRARLGVALAPITPEMRDRFNLPGEERGAVVAAVQPGSAAEQAGLQTGDVIVGVGTHAVGSPNDAIRAIRDATSHDKTVALRIVRDGQTAFVAVNVQQAENNNG